MELEPLEYFRFSPLAKLQKLSLDLKANKYFTAFRSLLEAKVFPELKSLSTQTPDGGFSIRNSTETIVDPAFSLIEILLGKAPKKNANTQDHKATSKPESATTVYSGTKLRPSTF